MKMQCLPLDIISTLPQNIIEIILTFMPTRDAVRTSILSRKWRYNWVKIPKLVFDHRLVIGHYSQMILRGKIFYAINHVLWLHQGPILELSLNWARLGNCFEIDLIILILARKNTLKKFTLNVCDYKLPSTFYSLQQLKHLHIMNCELESPSTFNGFRMLRSLCLNNVKVTEKVLLHLISGSPRLKHFTLNGFCRISTFQGEPEIVQLFKCFPVIEYLTLSLDLIMWSFTGRVPLKLLTSLVHLKYLNLSGCCLMAQHEFSFTLLLIRSSPNLKTIKIEILQKVEGVMAENMVFRVLEDYADVRLNHLTNVKIKSFSNSTAELEFLKLILVKSPMLKKVHIRPSNVGNDKEENKMLKCFLCLPRASPVQIIVRSCTEDSED